MAKKTKIQAQKEAKRMGLLGVHKMLDGSYMPGKTHKEYIKSRGG